MQDRCELYELYELYEIRKIGKVTNTDTKRNILIWTKE